MRQTSFNLGQILDLLKSGNSVYPSCMLVNEIGEIFNEDKDEDSENILLSFLDDKDPGHRTIAFFHLMMREEMVAKHHVALGEFRLKPENQQYLEEVDSAIVARLKQTTPSRLTRRMNQFLNNTGDW